ncbi:LEM-3-like GIY-YIG domain-containing protein [Roseibium algae]|uniref:GIY-YIG domain-containing protein n=1 Tax=Roseibium algae TaxID=3123038 RepID=A0ABU8TQR8_9HYPH
MKNTEDCSLFDSLVTEKLGHYVYVLIDPETRHPFYVGKGGGRQGNGNLRVCDHFTEAAQETGGETEKNKRIRKIWADDRDVEWRIVRSGLQSEEEALTVECALIDMLREMKVHLTNINCGYGSTASGLKSPTDLREWCAPQLDVSNLPRDVFNRPIFVFNIETGVKDRKSRGNVDNAELYENATCQSWEVTKELKDLKNAMAVGCIKGITRAAVDIREWKQVGSRSEIIVDDSESGIERREGLIFKNVSQIINHCMGFWQHGGYLVVRIAEDGQVKVERGSQDRLFRLDKNAG